MSNYCENCGAYIPANVKHCLACGQTVEKRDSAYSDGDFNSPTVDQEVNDLCDAYRKAIEGDAQVELLHQCIDRLFDDNEKQKNTEVVFPPPVTYGKDTTKSVIDLRPIVYGHKADVIQIDGHFTLKDAQASVKNVCKLPSPDDGTYRNILGEIITIRGDEFAKITLEIIGKLDE